jgi:8-oxo-dGTP pyrophosphatase MutT (NUDIX family)
MKSNPRDALQYAALPWRTAENGATRVLLLTSRETRRWVIPKGWLMIQLKPREVAAPETYEKAGLIGRIVGKSPVGSYHYEKQMPGDSRLCEVRVFL